MKWSKLLVRILAGGSLAAGGKIVFDKTTDKRRRARARAKMRSRIASLAVNRISEIIDDGIPGAPADQVYYFVWVVEKVSVKQEIDFPEFDFEVKDGLLFSEKLTKTLKGLISSGEIEIDGDRLVSRIADEGREADRFHIGDIARIIDELVLQWKSDFPDEPLVRFGKLFS